MFEKLCWVGKIYYLSKFRFCYMEKIILIMRSMN